MDLDPVTLDGEHVRLEPLSFDHVEALQAAGDDPRLFRWFGSDLSSPAAMREWVEAALDARDRGEALPFATVRRATDEVVGSTRFGNVAPDHDRVEIGWTWLAHEAQRTPVNTEAKYLMLEHAFETGGCIRVEFKTDSRNRRSRAALRRIGATEEGTLRQHMRTHQGVRDSVYYSVLDVEWPTVKRELASRLGRSETDADG